MVEDGKLNKTEIEKILPHRNGMLIVDSVVSSKRGNGFGYYTPKGTDFWVSGHFPNNPVVPGFVLLECMAQTSGVLYAQENNTKSSFPVVLFVKDAKFFDTITIGDEIKIESNFERVILSKVILYKCKAIVGDNVVSEATLAFGEKQ